MKDQVRRTHPAVMAERSASDGSEPSDPSAPVWDMEELGPVELGGRLRTGGDRWLCLGIAVLGALVGFGFIGRFAGDGTAARPPAVSGAAQVVGTDRAPDTATAGPAITDVPLTFITPVQGATIETTTLNVRGVASRRLGIVHLAVVLGRAVLGWTNVDVSAPGPLTASIPVFAPPVGVHVELLATVAVGGEPTASGSAAPTVQRSFWLHPGGPVGLWPAHIMRSNARTILVASGYAPVSVSRVQVRVVTKEGRTLANAAADVRLDDARPGWAGGYALGLGSFDARLVLGTLIGTGPLRVEVDWRDPIGGEWGTAVLTVVADMLSSHGR